MSLKELHAQLLGLQIDARDYLEWDHQPTVRAALSAEERSAAHFKFMVSLAAGLVSLDLSSLINGMRHEEEER